MKMKTKYLSLIPFANIIMVLSVMAHVYLIDMNMNMLLTLILAYIVVTGLIINKYKLTYIALELEWSKLIFIILVFLGIVSMMIMILLYENLDVIGILAGLGIGAVITLTQIAICLK